ncbi:MAG: hypothetical protein AAF699_07600 [Pseudomonadota bacterium]
MRVTPSPEPPLEPYRVLLWVGLLLCLILGFVLMTQLDVQVGDEAVHQFQMHWFIEGRYEHFRHVTVFPLYHWIVGTAADFTGLTYLSGLRMLHLIFAVGAILGFFVLCRSLYPAQATIRTAQFALMPLVFPFFFVTYTDIPSLLFVFFMLERTLRERYLAAALLGLIAIAMRQTNAIWVIFACGLIAISIINGQCKQPDLRSIMKLCVDASFMRQLFYRARFFIAVMLVFALAVITNNGFAMGDKEQHSLSLNISNLYFCLLVAFVLFLPFNIAQMGAIERLILQQRWIVPLLLLAFVTYTYTYQHNHPYNVPELGFYRHNLWLHYTADFDWMRTLAFLPMAWMALSFATAAIASPYRLEMLMLIPFALLSFVPLPLIEPRYYLVALSLFLVFRYSMSATNERFTLAYYAVASAYVIFHISRQNFFI